MRLNIVSAATGARWVRQGMRVFFRRPLAVVGLFFMFLALTALLSWLPLIGDVVALALIPAATVGLMAAAREVDAGRFPMPALLFIGFRSGPVKARAMLVLGALYALLVLLVIGLSALLDDGRLAQMIAGSGGSITREMLTDPAIQDALRSSMNSIALASVLYLPISVLFWHAPALVLWHEVPVVKSLFFSTIAVLRNASAYLLYGLAWIGVTLGGWALLLTVSALLGNLNVAVSGMFPLSITIAAMFYASLWFSFRDSFSGPDDEAPATDTPASA